MHPDNQKKMAFVTEWGVFVLVVMMFYAKNRAGNIPVNHFGSIR